MGEMEEGGGYLMDPGVRPPTPQGESEEGVSGVPSTRRGSERGKGIRKRQNHHEGSRGIIGRLERG